MSQPIIIALVFALIGCGSGAPQSQGAKKSSANGTGTVPLKIVAFGDQCADNGVASSVPGISARIGLQIDGFSPSTHSIGYVGQVANLTISPTEVRLMQPAAGTYSLTLVVRNIADCIAQQPEASQQGVPTANQCQPNGAAVQQVMGADLSRKLTFIISSSMQDFLQSGSIGSGQNGVVSDVINNKGLIGFLNKLGILGALGGGGGSNGEPTQGGLGSITGVLGSADKANQALEQARAQGNIPQAGCPQNPTAQSTQPSTTGGAAGGLGSAQQVGP